ncbi:STAS domain-containing protein [Kitasatospora sp. HPMI-4]|uniref:STAS domain-containing protein n=1 Tax=Kitasatospora sp. HPMI-4 TaxID=3448443 RepID=UPI003F1CBDC1
MSIQWELDDADGIAVLRLTGFLGEQAVHRFQGAFDWAVARCPGAVVIDLSALVGFDAVGEGAIVDAAGRLPRGRGPLAVASLRGRPAGLLTTSMALSVLQLFPDLETALAALGRR